MYSVNFLLILDYKRVNFMHLDLMSKFWDKQTRKINLFKLPTIEGDTAYIHIWADNFWSMEIQILVMS